jgi:hypothetical protein
MDASDQHTLLGGNSEIEGITNTSSPIVGGTEQDYDHPSGTSHIPRLLFTLDEASIALGISKWTLFTEVKDGHIDTVRIRQRQQRITPAALGKYIEWLKAKETA